MEALAKRSSAGASATAAARTMQQPILTWSLLMLTLSASPVRAGNCHPTGYRMSRNNTVLGMVVNTRGPRNGQDDRCGCRAMNNLTTGPVSKAQMVIPATASIGWYTPVDEPLRPPVRNAALQYARYGSGLDPLVPGTIPCGLPGRDAARAKTNPGASAGGKAKGPDDQLHVYLLAGGAYMAGPTKLAPADGELIERCYLLNDKDEWEPARAPLNRYSTIRREGARQQMGPGRGFVETMLAANPGISIGLVVNAGGGTENYIEHWRYKDHVYRATRKRIRKAATTGTFKGVLWHQNANRIDSSLSYIKDLAANIRMDFGELSLPFVAGGLPGALEHTSRHQALVADVHATGFARADDLTMDGKVPDRAGMRLLGKRYAEEMLRIQAEQRRVRKTLKPYKGKIIDAHLHASQNKKDGLDAVVRWMERNGVSRCISKPLPQTRAKTSEQRTVMLANFAQQKGKVDRFCLIEPGEVATVEEAVAILKKEMAEGAIGMGEHYGRGLMFDDPKNLLLFEACEKVGLPVHFHIDDNKNMDELGLPRLERVLKMFPKCNLIAHAQFWLQLTNGTCERLLRDYPNLYAEPSGQRTAAVLNRDRTYTREFLIRNADKILFGTDAGWWSFGGGPGNREPQFQLFEELDLPAEVKAKIYHKNAEKLFGFAT